MGVDLANIRTDIIDSRMRQMLTNRQHSIGTTTFPLQLLVSHQKRHLPFSLNFPDDVGQQP